VRSGTRPMYIKKIVCHKTIYPKLASIRNGDFIIIFMICNKIPHLFNNQLLDCTSTAVTLLLVAF
jgi:hypothetical protein